MLVVSLKLNLHFLLNFSKFLLLLLLQIVAVHYLLLHLKIGYSAAAVALLHRLGCCFLYQTALVIILLLCRLAFKFLGMH
jgi:hypothetical protein